MHPEDFHNGILLLLGYNIAALMYKRNMSTVELSRSSGIGRETIEHLTNNRTILTVPTLQTLHEIAKALDVHISLLFAEDQRIFDKL